MLLFPTMTPSMLRKWGEGHHELRVSPAPASAPAPASVPAVDKDVGALATAATSLARASSIANAVGFLTSHMRLLPGELTSSSSADWLRPPVPAGWLISLVYDRMKL